MEGIHRILVPASVTGLVLSAVWNATSWANVPGLGRVAVLLFLGVFAVWIPTIRRLRRIGVALQSRNGLWVSLEGAPRWVRFGVLGLLAYACISFVAGMPGPTTPEAHVSVAVGRMFSGHAMLFYGIAAAWNHAHERRSELGLWRCPAGHEVGPRANFCDVCGARINASRSRSG
jgi:hypothetical protein